MLRIVSRIAPLTAALFQLHSTEFIINSDNFALLVAEIGDAFCSDLTWEVEAVLALQAAAEDYVLHLCEVRRLSSCGVYLTPRIIYNCACARYPRRAVSPE